MKILVLAMLNFYKAALSPAIPSACKFYPTCSTYAVEAVDRHGPARGLWMAAGRLLRCRPLHPGGYDPVP
jgi:putative membrane protein insertion efficiency factor